jgi:hypothetical protein
MLCGNMIRLRSRLLVLACFVPTLTLAWHEGGHMTIAEIAWRRMTPQARAVAERLAKIGTDPKTDSFVTLSVWADDHKSPANATWHYRDTFFRDDGKKTDLKPDEENAVWAMEKFTKVLGDKNASDSDKAEALRFIVHIGADLHQPLHCVGRVTDEFPKGDRGGNDFAVVSPAVFTPKPRTLHFLWDMGCGLFGKTERPLTPAGLQQVAAWADSAIAMFPEEKHRSAARNLSFDGWTKEGVDLCKKQLYKLTPGTVPSEEYLSSGRKLCLERCALAGYRLANLLNKLLK